MFFVLSCVCYVFVRVCLYVLFGDLLGKGWPLGSRLWCLTVSLSLFHWYPGLDVVLDVSIPHLCTLTYFGINDHWATHCQKCPNIFNRLKNMAARGWDQFFSYVNIWITLKIFLSKSYWSIENNSILMVFEWPSTKIVHIFIGWKT